MRKQLQKFTFNTLYLTLLGSLIPNMVYAEEYAEFDAGFLRGGKDKEAIDISRFSYGNPIPAGDYVADVYLNNQLRGRINLQFAEIPNKNNAGLCANEDLLAVLDLKDEAFTGANTDEQAVCQFFAAQVPAAKVNFDMSELRLDVDLPQAFITQRPRGYISPAQ